jgi:ribonuclease HI
VNRLALLCLAHTYQGTPTCGMEVIYGIEPLDIFVTKTAVNTIVRINPVRAQRGLNPRVDHISALKKVCFAAGIDLNDVDRTRSRLAYKDFSIHTDNADPDMSDISVFTDGSKFKGQVGFGLVVFDGKENIYEHSEPMDSTNSVFEAEAQAINFSVKCLSDLGIKNRVIRLYSDSLSTVHSLQNVTMKNFRIQDTAHKLHHLAQKNKVSVHWTKAHVGTYGNEAADNLAKYGALTMGPTRFNYKKTLKQTKEMVKKFFDFLWYKRWTQSIPYRQSKLWFPWPNPELSHQILCLSRVSAGNVMRFCTGFNNLAYHTFNKKEVNSDLCRLCGEFTEESWHLANFCPAIQDTIRSCFASWGPQYQWKLPELLQFLNEEVISELTENRPSNADLSLW